MLFFKRRRFCRGLEGMWDGVGGFVFYGFLVSLVLVLCMYLVLKGFVFRF